MKKLLLFVVAVIAAVSLYAQAPNSFKYQAIARDASGNILTEQAVSFQISLLQGSVSGTVVYTETHIDTTNAFGLVNLSIGEGDTQDDMATIDWSNAPYFMMVEMDATGGSNYQFMGISQLLSVPYAMHAKTAENVFSGDYNDLANTPAIPANTSDLNNDSNFITNADDADADPTNEIQVISISNDTIYLSGGGYAVLPAGNNFSGDYNDLINQPDLGIYSTTDTTLDESEVDAMIANNGYLTAEVDGDLTNELQVLSISNDTIYLTDGGFVKLPAGFSGDYNDLTNQPDLGIYSTTDTTLTEAEVDAYVANNGYLTTEIDADATNEIQDLQLVGNILTITNNGTATEIDLSIYLDDTDTQLSDAEIAAMGYIKSADDGDADATNEIQDLQLVGNILTITNNGTATEIDLSAYLDNTDTQLSDAEIAAMGYIKSADDGDADATNEIQDLQLVGNILTITNNGTATEIDLSTYLDDTDTQLSDAEIAAMGYIKDATDADADATNEIQDLQLVGNILTITNNGTATEIDLSTYLDDTDTQLSDAEIAAMGYIKDATDADADNTNELNISLTLNGSTLELSDAGGTLSADLSSLSGGASAGTLSINYIRQKHTVLVGNDYFNPQDLYVNKGDTVEFVWVEGLHTTTTVLSIGNDVWDMFITSGNPTFTTVIDGDTIVDYYCQAHAETGRIIINNPDDVISGNSMEVNNLDNDPTNEIQNLSSVLQKGNDGSSMNIINIADPINPQDAATKAYVDNLVVAKMTTAERNAIYYTAIEGTLIYNTTLHRFEFKGIDYWYSLSVDSETIYDLDYPGSTHTCADCLAAGGDVTVVTGGYTLCKFSGTDIAVPAGWAQADNWQRYSVGTYGGDVCGNHKSTGPTTFSNTVAYLKSQGAYQTTGLSCGAVGSAFWKILPQGFIVNQVANPTQYRIEVGCK